MNTQDYASRLIRVVEATSDGQFQTESLSSGEWRVKCVIDKDSYVIGKFSEADAKKILRYCSMKPERARHAVRQLYLHGDYEAVEVFVAAALAHEFLEYRLARVTIEVQVGMKGSAEDIENYLREKLNYAVKIKNVNSIVVHED